MAANYLKKSRHGTIYYFRRRIPNDLRSMIGKPSLIVSLGTESKRQAIITSRACAAATDQLFRTLRDMPRQPKKEDIGFRIDYALSSVLDECGKRHAIANDVLPGQEQSAAIGVATLQAHLDGNTARSAPIALPGIPMADAIDQYLMVQNKSTTRRTYKGRLDHAQAYFGADKDIRHIQQVDMTAYAGHAVSGISNPRTAGFHITTFCGMLTWFQIRHGWGLSLTTKTLIPKSDVPDADDRDAFTLIQLAAVFRNAAKYRERQPYKYWATVTAAFTACRIEELAQLNLHTDLRHNAASGVWYFDLNAKADQDGVSRKSMKNKASWRCVPIHSALIAHGLVDYLLKQKDAGFTRPFESGWKPLILEGGNAFKWSHYITNWGGRELKKLVASDTVLDPEGKRSYFHSMRHTFSQCMGRAKIGAEVCEASLGHAYAGSERERYHKLKSDPDQLSTDGIEPGLVEIAALLQ